MDSKQQRTIMVDLQVRPSDVTDRRIPRAMLNVPREAFVPGEMKAIAHLDGNLKVAMGADRIPRMLLAPRTLAKMLQHLEIGDGHLVLDIAPATGYSTAILAKLARRVVMLEGDGVLAERAAATLNTLGLDTIDVVTGPITGGRRQRAPTTPS